ncbi:MAG: RES family NAD+ phosphorylase [Sphingobacteriaceae bacterium]|nr:RES family NAD+ phosphorylase [Sphingobacteriaceae bacterium]
MSLYFSSHRELQRKLKAFSKLNLAMTPYSKVLDIVRKEFLLPVTIAQIHSGQYVERIRINSEPKAFTRKDEISYINDPALIKTFGRANAPGMSMFYGSVMSSRVSLPMISALAETVTELQGINKGVCTKKMLITLGKWKVKKDLILAELVFNRQAATISADTQMAYQTQLENLAKNHTEFQLKQLVTLLEFYSEQFAKRSDNHQDYKISAAFTDQICKIKGIQGVIYPSVQTEFEGTNVALTPEAVDTCLELEEALILSVDIRNGKTFINQHFRTGLLTPGQESFSYGKVEGADQEVIEQYFLDNNEALKAWAERRKTG